MILLSAIIGLGAATLLLAAGYLFGVKRGHHAREHLRRQNLMQAAEMRQLPEQGRLPVWMHRSLPLCRLRKTQN